MEPILLSASLKKGRRLARTCYPDELLPGWAENGAPLDAAVTKDRFSLLTARHSIPLPTPPQMDNAGNHMISLSALGRWMAVQAEALGIDIFPGFAASEMVYDDKGVVRGVATGDMGIAKDGTPTAAFTPGVEIHARQTILAEGCHGSLTKGVIQKFDLRKGKSPQTYALGIKEVWEVLPEHHEKGLAAHTIGWPLDPDTYGGSWMYHMNDNRVSVGFVVALDYQNPYLSPFGEMQKFKTHPAIAATLIGGRRIAWGGRALVEGGLQSLPRLSFPGGVLAGDTAGFLNVPKIKGNHAAIKSGMLAAQTVFAALKNDTAEAGDYEERFRASWLYEELYRARNIRPGFRWGMWGGLAHAAFQTIGGWRLPYTLPHHADHAALKPAAECKPIDYPKPDGILTFDRLNSIPLSATNHAENQPSHLKLKNAVIPIAVNLPVYAEPAQRYCPAAVYEVVGEKGSERFVINAQNCIHCKTCDIKDPSQNIDWTVPEGGGGPNYAIT